MVDHMDSQRQLSKTTDTSCQKEEPLRSRTRTLSQDPLSDISPIQEYELLLVFNLSESVAIPRQLGYVFHCKGRTLAGILRHDAEQEGLLEWLTFCEVQDTIYRSERSIVLNCDEGFISSYAKDDWCNISLIAHHSFVRLCIPRVLLLT